VLGKILGGSTLAVGQSLLFYLLAPLVGLHFSWNGLFLVLVTLIFLSLALTALGYVIAWPMQSVQGFHAIMNLFLLPLWLLSGALFARETAKGWIQWIMTANPLTYGLTGLREAFDPGASSFSCGSAWMTGNLIMLAAGLVLIILAATMTQRTFRA
jgi:ABC-2 type transport system permease protein